LICLSHLRWGFVWQRPQHLMSRFARERRVFFVEEPVFHDAPARNVAQPDPQSGVIVIVPHLQKGLDAATQQTVQRILMNNLLLDYGVRDHLLWYYTPMALNFSRQLKPLAMVYDCMDELKNFAFAPPELLDRELELFRRADVVFTGGHSLYEAKRNQHHSVYPFPSSVDVAHFAKARTIKADPPDQAPIPHPRVGFVGVVDERMDLSLIEAVARMRPDCHFVMIGPVVKIDPKTLPTLPNIHWLGGKSYNELPSYLAGWDCAMMPFAHNDATKYISPTKTPEYLAAGLPVVSTSIRDVVRPYGERGLVGIADTPDEFAAAIDTVRDRATRKSWRDDVENMLSTMSWDLTWLGMMNHLTEAIARRRNAVTRRVAVPVLRPQATV
jgi:UDP-galactopyranose mutase